VNKKMKTGIQFFGIVSGGKFKIFAPQHLEGEFVRLTGIKHNEAASPESGEINLTQYEDKIIEVSGQAKDDWIYSAVVVEEAGPVLSDFLRKVFCRGEDRKKHCVLVVGHTMDSPGAVNTGKSISEFEFNNNLVPLIEKNVKRTKIKKFYRRKYEMLPRDINTVNPDFIVSLHCNDHDCRTSGSEVLYYHKSDKGKQFAEILLKHMVDYLKLPNRGIKPKTVEDKGGYLLGYTNAPCIIAEPFFIDNKKDLEHVMQNLEGLAAAYAGALDEISRILISEEEILIQI
jgi:N-acetylmuramoyl-L-alanine amidase